MKTFTEQFNTEAKHVRLSSAERSRIQAALMRAMEARAAVPSPFFMSPVFFRAMVAAAIVLFVGGGSAYAAQGALPGDLLYSIKTGVNEPIEGALAFSAPAKAKWHADVAVTRLAEAEALAQKGTLTASTSAELAANFSEHANAVAAITGDASAINPNWGRDIAAKFSSTVAHRGAAILAAGKKSNNALSLRASGDLVVNVAGDESNTNARAESASFAASSAPAPAAAPMLFKAALSSDIASTADLSSAETLSLRARAALAEATSTLAHAKLSDSQKADADGNVAEIENLLVKADAELSLGDENAAKADFHAALEKISALVPPQETESNEAPSAGAEDDINAEASHAESVGDGPIPIHLYSNQ